MCPPKYPVMTESLMHLAQNNCKTSYQQPVCPDARFSYCMPSSYMCYLLCSPQQAYNSRTIIILVLVTGKQNNKNPRQEKLRNLPGFTQLVSEAEVQTQAF